MHRFPLRIFIPVLFLVLAACTRETNFDLAQIEVPDMDSHHLETVPWTSLAALDDESRFHFVVMTDRTGGARAGVFETAIDKVNLLQPAFVMSVGDVIEGWSIDDEPRPTADWQYMQDEIDDLDAPFFHLAGNHEIFDEMSAQTWRENFGRSYYHFIYKDVLFLILNSEIFPGAEAWNNAAWGDSWQAEHEAQMAYAEAVLEANADVRWTFVFLHKPYWRALWVRPPAEPGSGDSPAWLSEHAVPDDWSAFEQLIRDRDYSLIAGHMHNYNYENEQIGEHFHEKISLATTGGGSRLRGPEYGEFDQLVWITITDNGPRIANLALDGILAKDFERPMQRPPWVD